MEKRQYGNYTKEQVEEFAKEVSSLSQLLNKLGLKPAGGNHANMKRFIQKHEIDCSHWKGQGWNKGDQLKDWGDYSRASYLKPHLIKLRSHKCEICQLTEWLNSPIILEVHHVDGNRTNNELENLQLLCCNCHSTTDYWRNRKMVATVGFEPTLNEA